MKDILTKQEVLLMTNTTFSAREYTDKNENLSSQKKEPGNKLAEACWNGMIPEMLPELFEENQKPLTIWQLAECRHLLYAHLGEEQDMPDAEYSLNPYVLIATAAEN